MFLSPSVGDVMRKKSSGQLDVFAESGLSESLSNGASMVKVLALTNGESLSSRNMVELMRTGTPLCRMSVFRTKGVVPPRDVVEMGLKDESPMVRQAVADRDDLSFSEEERRFGLSDPAPRVRAAWLARKDTPITAEIVSFVFFDVPSVLEAFLPRLGEGVDVSESLMVSMLGRDGACWARAKRLLVSYAGEVPESVRSASLSHEDVSVRLAYASRTDADVPPDVLEEWSASPYPDLRKFASEKSAVVLSKGAKGSAKKKTR